MTEISVAERFSHQEGHEHSMMSGIMCVSSKELRVLPHQESTFVALSNGGCYLVMMLLKVVESGGRGLLQSSMI